MSNPNLPGDNQDLSKRFRRIVNSSENQEAVNPELGHPTAGMTKPSEVQAEGIIDDLEIESQPVTISDEPESVVIQPVQSLADSNIGSLSPSEARDNVTRHHGTGIHEIRLASGAETQPNDCHQPSTSMICRHTWSDETRNVNQPDMVSLTPSQLLFRRNRRKASLVKIKTQGLKAKKSLSKGLPPRRRQKNHVQ